MGRGESLTILATTNGGINWPQVPSTSIIRDLRSVFFIDTQTGWMTGGSDANPVGGNVFISKMGVLTHLNRTWSIAL